MDQDYLDFGDDSDDERAESSDDEIDILLHGTPEQKRKLCRPSAGIEVKDESSSEDDFEKEMNAELNGRVKEMERRRGSLSEAGCSSSSVMDLDSEEPVKYYDDVYFDSDEEDMVNKGNAAASKRSQPTDDDLLYDPEADDDDEKWVQNQRRAYLPKSATAGSTNKKQKPLPNSDAVLDCPACMTTLCLDCQRHDVYENQYRAMFVSHCKVDTTEVLKYPKANSKRSRKRKKENMNGATSMDCDDNFHPVKCEECNTVVAVYDDDEVYHFFNVLSRY